MSLTADLVIIGTTAAACTAAVDASRRHQRVVVVSDTPSEKPCPFARQPRVSVLKDFEVTCVDGVNEIEVVLLRHNKTGRVMGINTHAVLVARPLPAGVISHAVADHVNHAIAG